MPSGPPEFIPPFILVTGMKCSYGKISSTLTEISVGKTEISETEPARPLIYEHIKNFTKDVAVRQDLGNRTRRLNEKTYPSTMPIFLSERINMVVVACITSALLVSLISRIMYRFSQG